MILVICKTVEFYTFQGGDNKNKKSAKITGKDMNYIVMYYFFQNQNYNK